MAYNTSNEYKQIIYTGDSKHKVYLSFNGIEFQNADDCLEKATITSRIIPNGNQGFYLDNFIAKELELILHDIPNNVIIEDQIEFKIGTYINNDYEYVPIGKFNIQDTPITDKDKITIKLRDNAVKFDFNYNAQPLMEQNDGELTYLQILDDICSQAGINYVGSRTFLGFNKTTSMYDNTIKGRIYVSYIASQTGCIATIDRNGDLTFIPLNTLSTIRIPLNIVESYEIGELFKITRVCYESGIIKYENPTKEDVLNTNDTLFIDGANPFIDSQEQIDNIKQIVNNFEFYSAKTGKVLGDPSIDSYDIIEIIDTDNNDEVVLKTLATNVLVYNGVCTHTFDTTITKEAKKENVTITSEPTFRKWAKTEIDNQNAQINMQVTTINNLNDRVESVESGINNTNEVIQTLSTTVTQNNTSLRISIDEINQILEDGVENVKNKTVEINNNGLVVSSTNSEFVANLNNTNLNIKQGTEELIFSGYDPIKERTETRVPNMLTQNTTAGNHRISKYRNDRTGHFYIGGN